MKRPNSHQGKYSQKAHLFFDQVIGHGKTIIWFAIVASIGMATFIPNIRIDTSVEAFISPDHPSLVSRDRLKEIFGLSDPIILAVENNGPEGI